ncbi:MAG: AMP-binding protein, partial [Actinobacteria bacterium]|nr:AMP-binding protein [Actinomycetota bacterium]
TTPMADQLYQILRERAARWPDAVALGSQQGLLWRTLTSRELLDRVDRLADELAALGVGPGDRVVAWLPSHWQTSAYFFAIWKLGAVLVPFDREMNPDAAARIVVQSELVANEPGPEETDDPRAAAALRAPLVAEHHAHSGLRANLVHRARASGLQMAAGMDHIVEGPEGTVTASESEPDLASQPTLSRLENAVRATSCYRLALSLAHLYRRERERVVPGGGDRVVAQDQ